MAAYTPTTYTDGVLNDVTAAKLNKGEFGIQSVEGNAAQKAQANTFTATQVIDTGAGATTSLVIKRNESANTTALRLENATTGGRTTLTFRDETGTDVCRLVAHNANDPAGVASGFRVYRRRATPRIDGVMHDNTFLIQSDTDFGIAGFFGATFIVNTHDTDGNLWTDKNAVQIQRSPADSVNESTQLLRPRTSGNGSNYMHRDLGAADTAGPLLNITNANSGDTQNAVRIVNAGSGMGLLVSNTGPGRALNVTATGAAGADPAVDITKTGNSSSEVGGLRVNATNAGTGGVYGLHVQTGRARFDGALDHRGTTAGFYAAAPVAKQTGVAVTAAGVHAALVNLGLIAV